MNRSECFNYILPDNILTLLKLVFDKNEANLGADYGSKNTSSISLFTFIVAQLEFQHLACPKISL